MKAIDLDKKFIQNEVDIVEEFGTTKSKRINHEQKRVNVDFLNWMV
jgi:hypothetical protein